MRGVRARAETLAFRLALAAAAAVGARRRVLAPRAGHGAGDHLASGLVPLALAALLAFVYPRLRPGARAIAALTAGPLMIVAGVVDGVRHVAVDRLSGDDVTAMLAGVAGVVLVGLGAAVLWRSRRLDERPAATLPAPDARRRPPRCSPASSSSCRSASRSSSTTRRARRWRAADLGRPYVDVTLTTSDGLRLAGWYVPSRNGAAVIAFPGRTRPGRRTRACSSATATASCCSTAAARARAKATSTPAAGAASRTSAPPSPICALAPTCATARIGGLGLSVGGELLLQTAAHDRGLRAVVSEGAGMRSVAEQKHMPDAPGEPIRWIAPITMETAAGVVLADHLPPTDLVDLMPRIAPRPVLLIRGMEGNADEALNRVYRDAGGASVTLWEIPRAGHTAGISAVPAEYERRIVEFFDRALLG